MSLRQKYTDEEWDAKVTSTKDMNPIIPTEDELRKLGFSEMPDGFVKGRYKAVVFCDDVTIWIGSNRLASYDDMRDFRQLIKLLKV